MGHKKNHTFDYFFIAKITLLLLHYTAWVIGFKSGPKIRNGGILRARRVFTLAPNFKHIN